MTHQDIFQYFVPLEILVVTLPFLQLLTILPEVLQIESMRIQSEAIRSHRCETVGVLIWFWQKVFVFLLFSYKFAVWFYAFIKSFLKHWDVNTEAYNLVVALCWMIMKQDLVHALKSFILCSFTGVPRRGDPVGCGSLLYKLFWARWQISWSLP